MLGKSSCADGVFRSLGRAESKEAEQESLLLEFDVPYRPFGKAILDCLPPQGDQWVVAPKPGSNAFGESGEKEQKRATKEWEGREDLRELIVCSIDPPGFVIRGRVWITADGDENRVSGYR